VDRPFRRIEHNSRSNSFGIHFDGEASPIHGVATSPRVEHEPNESLRFFEANVEQRHEDIAEVVELRNIMFYANAYDRG
jgi:hypothetical protein